MTPCRRYMITHEALKAAQKLHKKKWEAATP